MAWDNTSNQFSLPADADLSARQYRGVILSADGEAALAGAAPRTIQGILQNDPLAGEAASIQHSGVSKAEAGGVVTLGDLLTTDADGQFVLAAGGQHVHAIALEAATGAGSVIPVLLGYRGTA